MNTTIKEIMSDIWDAISSEAETIQTEHPESVAALKKRIVKLEHLVAHLYLMNEIYKGGSDQSANLANAQILKVLERLDQENDVVWK